MWFKTSSYLEEAAWFLALKPDLFKKWFITSKQWINIHNCEPWYQKSKFFKVSILPIFWIGKGQAYSDQWIRKLTDLWSTDSNFRNTGKYLTDLETASWYPEGETIFKKWHLCLKKRETTFKTKTTSSIQNPLGSNQKTIFKSPLDLVSTTTSTENSISPSQSSNSTTSTNWPPIPLEQTLINDFSKSLFQERLRLFIWKEEHVVFQECDIPSTRA